MLVASLLLSLTYAWPLLLPQEPIAFGRAWHQDLPAQLALHPPAESLQPDAGLGGWPCLSTYQVLNMCLACRRVALKSSPTQCWGL